MSRLGRIRISHWVLGIVLLSVSIASASELCNVISGIDINPSPVVADYSGDQMRAEFTMDAEFDSKAPYKCGCCEYRQKLKPAVGKKAYTEDGNALDHRLVDSSDPTKRINLNDQKDFVEDYSNYDSGNLRYGHREEDKSADEDYTNGGTGADANTVNRKTGCRYHGYDRPGIGRLRSGHSYEVNLVFHVEIVCVQAACGAGGKPHKEKDFDVTLKKSQP